MDGMQQRRRVLALLRLRDERRRWGVEMGSDQRLRRLALIYMVLQRQKYMGELRRPRRWFRRPAFQQRAEHGQYVRAVHHMKEHDPEEFFNVFRVTVEVFDELKEMVFARLWKRRVEDGISVGHRLALTMYYLATGCYQRYAGSFFSVPAPTTCGIVLETCNAIYAALAPQYFPPLTEELITESMNGFWERWNFPNCWGALDGRHNQTQNFANGAADWHNYHGYYSMVMLTVVSSDYRILWADIGGRGRRHDNGLWEECDLLRSIRDGTLPLPPPRPLPGGWASTPPVLVADAAFTGGPHLIKPYPGQMLSDDKVIFNYRHSRARRTSENVFAIESSRFRVIRRLFVASQETARVILKCVAALHNYLVCSQRNVPPHKRWYMPNLEPEGPPMDVVEQAVDFVADDHDSIREHLTDFFLGPGAVPWQWDHLTRPRP